MKIMGIEEFDELSHYTPQEDMNPYSDLPFEMYSNSRRSPNSPKTLPDKLEPNFWLTRGLPENLNIRNLRLSDEKQWEQAREKAKKYPGGIGLYSNKPFSYYGTVFETID